MVASLYAMGYSPSYIYVLFKKYAKKITSVSNSTIMSEVKKIMFSRRIETDGIKDGKDIEDIYDKFALKKGIKSMGDISMPLIIPSVDISESKQYIFSSIDVKEDSHYISDISVGKAVRASSSFPAVINPCRYKGHIFLDGATLNNIPVKEIKKMGADKIIAIKFDSDSVSNEINVIDIVMKAVDIMSNRICEESLTLSDCIITIPAENTGLLDASRIEFCYKLGYDTIINNIDRIKDKLEIQDKGA